MALIDKLTNIADAIREQTGKTEPLSLDDMATSIGNISGTNFRIIGGTAEPKTGDTLYWDGNIEGRELCDFGDGMTFYKVSDIVPTEAELSKGIFGTFTDDTGNIVTIDLSNYYNNILEDFILLSDAAVIAINDNDRASKGIYFCNYADANYLASLKIKGFIGFEKENVKENTIWVNTDVDISSWIFSATEPESSVESMVWFSTGTASPVAFNILENNGVIVYPISVKQYINGVWTDVEAKSYQNGAWESWITYYYKNGNTYDDMTGGYTYNSNTTMEADNIKMYTDGDGAYAYATTNNKIDISGISTLSMKFNLKAVSSYDRTVNVYLYVSDNKLTNPTQSVGTGATVSKAYNEGTDMEDIIELDVSSITGSKYIFVCAKNTGKYFQVTTNIKEIRGE